MTPEQGSQSRDQFKLSKDELKCPQVGRSLWMQSLIGFQLEGLEFGVVPQFAKSPPYPVYKRWYREVWETYLKSLPDNQTKRNKARLLKQGRQKHTRLTTGAAGTLSLRVKRS